MIHVIFMPLSCKGKRYEKHVTDNIIVNIQYMKSKKSKDLCNVLINEPGGEVLCLVCMHIIYSGTQMECTTIYQR